MANIVNQDGKAYSQRVLRVNQVSEKVGLCVSAIWAKTSPQNARYDATFPKPFKVSANATVWLESELDAWLSAKAASRISGGMEGAE